MFSIEIVHTDNLIVENRAHPDLVVPGLPVAIASGPDVQPRVDPNGAVSGSGPWHVVLLGVQIQLFPGHSFCEWKTGVVRNIAIIEIRSGRPTYRDSDKRAYWCTSILFRAFRP